MDQTRATNRLVLLSLSAGSMGVPNFSNFFYPLCGLIWMTFGGPETQHGESPPHRMTFFCLAQNKKRIHNRNFFL